MVYSTSCESFDEERPNCTVDYAWHLTQDFKDFCCAGVRVGLPSLRKDHDESPIVLAHCLYEHFGIIGWLAERIALWVIYVMLKSSSVNAK